MTGKTFYVHGNAFFDGDVEIKGTLINPFSVGTTSNYNTTQYTDLNVTGTIYIFDSYSNGIIKIANKSLILQSGLNVTSIVIQTVNTKITGTLGVSGATVLSSLTVSSEGIVISTKGLTVANQGIYIATKGLTITNEGLYVVTKGLTLNNEGMYIATKGLTVADEGIVVNTKGLTLNSHQ